MRNASMGILDDKNRDQSNKTLMRQRLDTQGSAQGMEKGEYKKIFQVLSEDLLKVDKKKEKDQNLKEIMDKVDTEDGKTRKEVQKQLLKIIHKTWNIFDPTKKQKQIDQAL